MSDLIRMASHAHHYLAVFDNGTPLALYHTRRLASPAQRIMLYAKDRGCTKPGCDAPAYHSQVHHVQGWTRTHRTDINDLTLACGNRQQTRRKKAGPPQKRQRRHRMDTTTTTWIADNPAPTPTTTRRFLSDGDYDEPA